MTKEFKNIIFSTQVCNVLQKYSWNVNLRPESDYHSFFIGEIADYYLNIYINDNKLIFEFTLDMEIPKSKLNEVMRFVNFANQKSKEGYFVFNHKVKKIKYKLIKCFSSKIDKNILKDYLKINLNLTNLLFHNFMSGIHNLIYGEKLEDPSLELLFLNCEGCA